MIICYHDIWEFVLVKKKKLYKYNLGLKKLLVTLNDYLLSCGGGNGGGGGGSGDIAGYIILLW